MAVPFLSPIKRPSINHIFFNKDGERSENWLGEAGTNVGKHNLPNPPVEIELTDLGEVVFYYHIGFFTGVYYPIMYRVSILAIFFNQAESEIWSKVFLYEIKTNSCIASKYLLITGYHSKPMFSFPPFSLWYLSKECNTIFD